MFLNIIVYNDTHTIFLSRVYSMFTDPEVANQNIMQVQVQKKPVSCVG